MKALRLLLALSLVLAPWPALAAQAPKVGKTVVAVPADQAGREDLATLLLPESVDGVLVDGLDYPGLGSVFRRGDMALKLLPGEREVALRYNQLFKTTADDHDVVKSKVMVLRFVAEPGQVYRAAHARFRDAAEAREGVKNFVLRIEDAAGNNRVIGATQTSTSWRGEQVTTARPDLVSPVAAAAVAPAVPPPAGGLNALDLLKFTWQNAGATDRAAFLEWLKANP